MKQIIIAIIIIIMAGLCVLPLCRPQVQYVAGRIYIRSRGITAEVYTTEPDPIDGMSSLWHGGRVTTKTDLSGVKLGDMAEVYTVEGEHLVLECIGISRGWAWYDPLHGDIVITHGKWEYRFTRL